MVDGPVLVADVLRSSLTVEQVFAGPSTLEDHGLDSLVTDGAEVFEVDPSVLSAVLDPVNPRPVAAVVSVPAWEVDDLPPGDPVLVAVELRDPGNLGTMMRTAEAAGFGGLVVVGDSVDPYAPKVVRASAGSIFRLPVIRIPSVGDAYDRLRQADHPVVATVVDPEAESYDTVDLRTAAIVVGNEPHGLSTEAIKLGDGRCTIPLSRSVESLNVAAAASVLCFEAARQRRSGIAPGPKSVGH